MVKSALLGILLTAFLACSNKQVAPTTVDEGRTPMAPLVTPPIDAGNQVEVPTLDASSPAIADSLVPVEALQASKVWPFFSWDRAQSFVFNLQQPGPGVRLRVYSQSQGWTESPTEGPLLSDAQAKKAMSLLSKTQGELIVSKCPFPRHGIVFFQKGVPVGSISVCFECGDIMIWPAYSQDPNWMEKKSRRYGTLMKAYDRVFPQWESLFDDELGLAKDWTQLGTKGANETVRP